MAYKSSDGMGFTNRPAMKLHEGNTRRMAAKSQAGGMATKDDPLSQPGEPDGDEQQDGAQIAQEHGPAVEVHIMHPQDGGADMGMSEHEGENHHVHSVHPDGHEHHSDHPTKHEAHEHGKKLAGADDQDEQREQPEMEAGGE
jgi:hypothetical protein